MMSLLNGRLRHLCSICGSPVSQPMGDEKALIQRMLGKELTLPQPVWSKLIWPGLFSLSFAVWQTSTSHLAAAKYLGQL